MIITMCIAYWLVGIYVGCLWHKQMWPALDVDGETIAVSMAILWMMWPLLAIYILLYRHFNQSKGGSK